MPRRHLMPDVIRDQDVVSFPPYATVRAAARRMADKRIGAVPVVDDDGTLRGIFTERDLTVRVLAPGRDPDLTLLSDVMTANPDTLAPDATAYEALDLMERHSYRHLPVVADGRVLGVVSIRDLFAVVRAQLEQEIKERENFMFGSGYSLQAAE